MSVSSSSRYRAADTIRRCFSSSSASRSLRSVNERYVPANSLDKKFERTADTSKQIASGEDEIPYKWEPPEIEPDIQHPSYRPDHIMDFRDQAARFPPAVQAKRFAKLKRARELGIRHTQFNKPVRDSDMPFPDVPVFLDATKNPREKVKYQIGKVGVTNDRREFFEDEVSMREDVDEVSMNWEGIEDGSDMLGIEVGRIVECRRSHQMTIGMILASLVVSGRPRFLLLKSTGEIWPLNPADVQFIMPLSLIPPQTAEKCWSPELLDLWARGEEATGAEIEGMMEPMQQARREAVMVLRKISRETERMCGKIMSGMSVTGRIGGIDGLWEEIAPKDESERTSITSHEVAERLLNKAGEETKITVKPNTLPAYAAHTLMMARPDIFLSGQTVQRDGRFLVRSRSERARLKSATRMTDRDSVDDDEEYSSFIEKAKRVIAETRKVRENSKHTEAYTLHKHDIPDWTPQEADLIWTIMLRTFESRSTQSSPLEPLINKILRALGCYDGITLDRDLLPQLLLDLGVQQPWDTVKRSEIEETAKRAMAMEGVQPRGEGELLKGNELDSLRVDFTSHKVFVVDDPTATELDDGIAIERIEGSDSIWVHVHVADPTRYIPLNHPVSQQASFQCSSFYAPEGNVPLFPLDVIMKELSLGAEVSRDDGAQGSMVFSTKLSPSGEVLDSDVRMGWIKKPRVVTYQAVDKALGVESGRATKPFGTPKLDTRPTRTITDVDASDMEDLRLIQRFATAYRSRRLATAGFDAYPPQTSLSVLTKLPNTASNLFDRSQFPAGPMIYSGSPILNWTVKYHPTTYTGLAAGSIIAEFMILAGRTAASWCRERNLPVPYRLSSAPEPTILPGQQPITLEDLLSQRDPKSMTSDPYTIAAASLRYTAGRISLDAGEHWTMGFTDNNGYIRATSPLRRFDDMLVHWQIKSALAKEKNIDSSLAPAISREDMQVFADRIGPAEKKVKKASSTATLWWEAGLFASRLKDPRPDEYVYGDDFVDITQPISARIAGPTQYGTNSIATTTPVFIPELGATSRLPGKGVSTVRVGDEVRVRVKQAIQWPAVLTDVELVD